VRGIVSILPALTTTTMYFFDDFFLFLLVGVAIFGVIRVVSLSHSVQELRKRLEYMEKYLQDATKYFPTSSHSSEDATAHASAPVVAEARPAYEMLANSNPSPRYVVASGPDPFDRFFAWCKEDWLMKLGGALSILGMAWFVSYAVAQGWIGEYGRIGIALTVGACVLTLGWYRLQRFVAQGSVLMFAGATIVVLAVFAGRELYDIFTPEVALVIMFGTSALLGVTSVLYRRIELAYGNVLLAGLAPLLIDATLTLPELFTYLLVLSAGAVAVALNTGWRVLPLISLVIVTLYSVARVSSHYEKDLDIGLLYAFVFTGLYFGVSVLSMRVLQTLRVYDLLTALGSGGFLLMWVLSGAKDEWQSMLLLLWAVVFALGAFLATRLGAGIEYFFAYAGVGVVYIAVVTALELDGPTLAIASILEAGLLLWLGFRITGRTDGIPLLVLPSVFPLFFTFESMGSPLWSKSGMWHERLLHSDALVLVVMMLTLGTIATLFAGECASRSETIRRALEKVAQTACTLMGLYLAVFVWLASHAVFIGDTGTVVALLFYTLVAIMLYLMHRNGGKSWMRLTAGVLIAFVVGRLLIVDAWNMDLGERVMVFLLVGISFMVVAWFERNHVRDLTASSQ
jgi:uncharacterized membrane protein